MQMTNQLERFLEDEKKFLEDEYLASKSSGMCLTVCETAAEFDDWKENGFGFAEYNDGFGFAEYNDGSGALVYARYDTTDAGGGIEIYVRNEAIFDWRQI